MALIEIKKLGKIYDGGENETRALSGVDLTIERGDFVAVMGPSGSGKSTLLHILGFLDDYTFGQYFFDGKEIGKYLPDEVARLRNQKFGFVFQAFNLLPRTNVLENVKMPLVYSDVPEKAWDNLARQAIEAVGLTHRAEHEPSQLSGGEKQRVAIARALVNNPEVIFADEPTGNLDSKSGQAVMDIIWQLNIKQKKTIILITHETYTAEHARRIIRLLDGEIESVQLVANRRGEGDFEK
ncbi:MAG: ABC transporter related protein [Parcubacteria group bacterium GW2011_GWB1_44_7]|nr:MAG: ABC transporter related protein [Parcubacteria group bacterium GW2011_GWB1_44_7]